MEKHLGNAWGRKKYNIMYILINFISNIFTIYNNINMNYLFSYRHLSLYFL